ncbi:MAG: KH domain-containing protein [Clostridia bacterium]
MKDLLEMVAKALVDNPDEVFVHEKSEEDGSITLELKVAQEDMGKVIGRNGRIAKSLRTLIKASAIKTNTKVNVEII